MSDLKLINGRWVDGDDISQLKTNWRTGNKHAVKSTESKPPAILCVGCRCGVPYLGCPWMGVEYVNPYQKGDNELDEENTVLD